MEVYTIISLTARGRMYHVYAKPVQFSDCHGCNVVVKMNRNLAEGKYLRAHGQFITQTPLSRDKPFDLHFSGTGIVKFTTFPNKPQAVDWVRSKQPLPGGCRRIRMTGSVQYSVHLPEPGTCVLFEPQRNPRRQFFTLEAGPTTTLAFDMECGDIVASIVTPAASNVTFDTFCHSHNIQMSKSSGGCSAALWHYNPSSLCCLDDASLDPSDIFILEATNSSFIAGSGSYIRVCVAKRLSPYENNGQTQCCGSPSHPCYKGKRILIAPDSSETLIVRVLPEGLRVDRGSKRVLDTMRFPLKCDQTLWFELHHVSLRTWQVCDLDSMDPDDSFITFTLANDDLPPSEPAPQPPSTRPRQISLQQQSRYKTKHGQLKETGNSRHRSDTTFSDASEVNRLPTSGKMYRRYISADTSSSTKFRNHATVPKSVSAPSFSTFSRSGDNSTDDHYVTVISNAGQHKASDHQTLTVNAVRNEMCQNWVAAVKKIRNGFSSHENDAKIETRGLASPQGKCDRYQPQYISTKDNRTTNKDRIPMFYQQSNESKVPTSSVWLEDVDVAESVKHNFEFDFVPAQGVLRCHSYYSNPRNSAVESKKDQTDAKINLTNVTDSKHLLSKDLSTCANSETFPKTIDCGGINVNNGGDLDTCNNLPDEFTYLKELANQDKGNIKESATSVAEVSKNYHCTLPKHCLVQSVSKYSLASPLSPVIHQKGTNLITSNLTNSNGNQFEKEDSCSDESENNDDTLTFITRGDKENEVNEQTMDSDSGVVSMRYHWRKKERNIIESSASNCSVAVLCVGPTVRLPDSVQDFPNQELAFERSETLRRNLDAPPRASIRKDSGSKIKSIDFIDDTD